MVERFAMQIARNNAFDEMASSYLEKFEVRREEFGT